MILTLSGMRVLGFKLHILRLRFSEALTCFFLPLHPQSLTLDKYVFIKDASAILLKTLLILLKPFPRS